mgnify:FL=1
MAQINELPNEVLEQMTRSKGIDLNRVEPEAQDVIKPDMGSPAQPNREALRNAVNKMGSEQHYMRKFNQLLKTRETFNANVQRLNQTQADDMLKQRANSNRSLLAKTFLRGR